MRPKSEAFTPLYRINWDFGVSNKISVDNEPNKTSYNTEIHGLAREAIMGVCAT